MSLAIASVITAPTFTLAQNNNEQNDAAKEHSHSMQHKHDEASHSKPQYRWSKSSESGTINIEIFPQGNTLVFNDFHTWIVELTDHHGRPITDAQIAIDGGMKAHGHGLPSKPELGSQLGGQYLIEGMLFNMTGEWTLAFQVITADEKERFIFPITLSH